MAKKSGKKPEDKVTKKGTVELEEGDLDEAKGGGFDTYLKVGSIDSYKLDTSLDPKLTEDYYKLTSFDSTIKK